MRSGGGEPAIGRPGRVRSTRLVKWTRDELHFERKRADQGLRPFAEVVRSSRAAYAHALCSRSGRDIAARAIMRALSFTFLATFLMAVDAFAQTAQLAPISKPFPFPQGSSVFQRDYECIGQKGCGFTGFGLDRLTLRSASIVLARLKVGEIEMPTYFIWGMLIDSTPVTGMVQNEFSFRFSAVNMRLIAAGPPGL